MTHKDAICNIPTIAYAHDSATAASRPTPIRQSSRARASGVAERSANESRDSAVCSVDPLVT